MDIVGRFSNLVFESIPHGIFTVDAGRRITSFNPEAEQITGWKAADAIGRRCADVFKSDHCETSCVLLQSVQTGKRHRDHEVRIVRRDGTPRTIAVSTAALPEMDGGVGGVEMFRDITSVCWLRTKATQAYLARDIVSRSANMDRVRELVKLVAQSESTVLIQGEPGTGKELVARAIHNLGERAKGPFIAVNCGAIPDTLIESELFGHERGAYTDAKQARRGRLAEAEGGTVLLDEVSELSPSAQVKLLRVLQEREYTPLGSDRARKADIRVLAATNRDLEEAVEAGDFRRDLYFRLDVVRLHLPPLRERTGDVPLLVSHFIDRFNALQKRDVRRISDDALAHLANCEFPGNVRELENAIEHAFVVCRGHSIDVEHLPAHLTRGAPRDRTNASRPLENAEARAINAALNRHGRNRTRAAEDLGVSRSTLWRKMRRHEIA